LLDVKLEERFPALLLDLVEILEKVLQRSPTLLLVELQGRNIQSLTMRRKGSFNLQKDALVSG
jgi:hypothetical protein